MASVRKRKSPKGEKYDRWIVDYVDGVGERHIKTFTQKKSADQYRVKVEGEVERGVHIAASQAITVSELCDHFLRRTEDRLRDGQIGKGCMKLYKVAVDCAIIPYLGKRLVKDLKPEDILSWFQWMRRERKLAVKTARERVKTMRLVEDFAIRRGFAKETPCRAVQPELRGMQNDRVRTFQADEIVTLLQHAGVRARNYRERPTAQTNCFVHIAACCGLRFGEIVALTLGNVDLDRRILRVRHNLTEWDDLKGPKTRAGNRDVPMPPQVAQLVSDWIRKHYVPNDRQLVFRTSTGGPVPLTSWHRTHWKPLLERAGLGNKTDAFHFHALRHFAASWMIEHGMPIMDVASLMGHAKFDMTLQTYAHPVVGGMRRHDIMDGMARNLILAPSDTPSDTQRPE